MTHPYHNSVAEPVDAGQATTPRQAEDAAKEMTDKAVAAMVAAIGHYNTPGSHYREETFAILATNGWELLLKAKWLDDHGNNLESLYASRRKTRAGNPQTYGISVLAGKMFAGKTLPQNAWENIKILVESRDSAVHFYDSSPHFRAVVHGIGVSCVKNFSLALRDWFDREMTEFDFPMLPLAFVDMPASVDTIVTSPAEGNFLSFVEGICKSADSESPYSITANIEYRVVGKRDISAPPIRITDNPEAPEFRVAEEEMRQMYPWDYNELTAVCRERYSDFKAAQLYHKVRKSIESDRQYVWVRYVDTVKKTGGKNFYSRSIFQEFDKHFTRK